MLRTRETTTLSNTAELAHSTLTRFPDHDVFLAAWNIETRPEVSMVVVAAILQQWENQHNQAV
jgi:hypothetical protein